ncbi:hypothetical protein MSG28_011995 [Choristoneura fumiferana]|uniref:Uncharacterized protein n=1 Tax=Choristoneura fumiferana TaxID=7141 RepID=A0ACC0KNY5_CHOFU|nr:hypothetical protein MSG28_011995 [Choristoneura fumiferana]
MSVSLCCSFVRLIFTCYLWSYLWIIASKEYTLFAAVLFEDVYACLMMCLPAILMDKTIDEVNKMKIILGDQLLACDDDKLRVALEEALDYLDQRPIKMTICRAVTVDATLPFIFFSLCTTGGKVTFLKERCEKIVKCHLEPTEHGEDFAQQSDTLAG